MLTLGAAALAEEPAPAPVLLGIDVLEEHEFRELKNKSIGLITNQTGLDRGSRSTIQVLANAPGVRLRALFSPEHGFAGTSESEEVGSGIFLLPDGSRIPMYSLYGSTRAPTPDTLRGLNALVFDIQDAGARFYTYATTMAMAMESAAKAEIEFIVLDRPNPINGETVEGPILDPDIRHFIAYFPIPVRHGLTIGEIARLHNQEARLGARLQIVPMKNWKRSLWYDQTGLPWVRPSPNLPDLDAATLYPGIACFEAANVSVGRGTDLPFRWVGAPWMDAKAVVQRLRKAGLKGVSFAEETFTPAKSVFAGRRCPGVRMRVTDRKVLRSLEVFAHLAAALRDQHPKEFALDLERMPRFTGSRRFNELFSQGAAPKELIELFDAGAREFLDRRAHFLLY
ncbi:MAG: hypothetical protein A2X36_14000 [Elusimicrobia bacterium GWA2_69_24]|nr:MAG: hypothetical protein A2X36_14000 [Elusimicrobia bacterium GWA2_69_24]